MKHAFKVAALCLFAGALLFVSQGTAWADDGGLDLGSLVFDPPAEKKKKKTRPPKKAKFKIGGFMQIQFSAVENDKQIWESGDKAAIANTYDQLNIKRLILKGSIMDASPGLSTCFVLNFASSSPLLDAWIQWKMNDFLYIRAGQMLIPFGWQMPSSAFSLHTINYSQSTSALCPVQGSALRDKGFYIGGSIGKKHGKAKDNYLKTTEGPFYWKVGVFNGSGRNVGAENVHPAFCLRLACQPLSKTTDTNKTRIEAGKSKSHSNMVDFGISYWLENEKEDFDSPNTWKKVRFGIDFRVHVSNCIFQGEFVMNTGTDDKEEKGYGEYKQSGFFFELGYKFVLSKKSKKKKIPAQTLVPMIKYDMLMQDSEILDGTGNPVFPYGNKTVVAIGANYHMADCAYLQLFYEMHMEQEDAQTKWTGTVWETESELFNDKILLQMNMKF